MNWPRALARISPQHTRPGTAVAATEPPQLLLSKEKGHVAQIDIDGQLYTNHTHTHHWHNQKKEKEWAHLVVFLKRTSFSPCLRFYRWKKTKIKHWWNARSHSQSNLCLFSLILIYHLFIVSELSIQSMKMSKKTSITALCTRTALTQLRFTMKFDPCFVFTFTATMFGCSDVSVIFFVHFSIWLVCYSATIKFYYISLQKQRQCKKSQTTITAP